MNYKHGAYSNLGPSILLEPNVCTITPVYIGTAPVHQAQGGTGRVNVPIAIRTMEEAQRLVGYSDDWQSYTLCEMPFAHFANGDPIGPIVLINVFDPLAYQEDTATSVAGVTFTRAGAVLSNMENAILDTITIPDKEIGVDFSATYLPKSKSVRITVMPGKTLPASATVTYRKLGNVTLTEETVIGAPSEIGDSTGIHAVDKVYQATGMIPHFMNAAGWHHIPEVKEALLAAHQQISGHWHAFVMLDIPLSDKNAVGDDVEITIDQVVGWKNDSGYTSEFCMPNWPMCGKNGRVFHKSVLEIVTQMRLDFANGNVPYTSADNQSIDADCALLYGGKKALFGPEVLNNHLAQHGIGSAIYWGGQWRCWGPHTAAVIEGEAEDPRSVYVVNIRMMLYLANWFQLRFWDEIGKPYTRNRAQSIQADCQAYLDALKGNGALIKGECTLDHGADSMADVLRGALRFNIAATNTPPLRSLEATLRYDETGLKLIFADE